MKAGDRVPVSVNWLEMDRRPEGPFPPLPMEAPVSLMRAAAPPAADFLFLYHRVGRDYEWTDRHAEDEDALRAFVQHGKVQLHTMMFDGWPGGFFVLDAREAGVCDLAYFGLAEAALGRGLGKWLLGEAVRTAWALPGVERVTVNTCSLDHPRALPMYQRAGFRPVRRTEVERVLTRDRKGPGEGGAQAPGARRF